MLIAKEKENLVTTHTSTVPSKLSQEINYTSSNMDSPWAQIFKKAKYLLKVKRNFTSQLWLQLPTTDKSVNNLVLLSLATDTNNT